MCVNVKPFNRIQFMGYEIADNSEYYPKRKSRDEVAREAFMRELEKDDIEGIFMRDILREKMEATDERLR